MPFNVSGTLVPLHLLINPRLVISSVIVKDIRQLDFRELRKAGYRGAVFDKDNCVTIPHRDQLVPELKEAWNECREAFGENNVLIVSNSAGTRLDPGGIQAESVSHYLNVPVLRHLKLKPSYACITSIRKYFSSLPEPVKDDELIVVGDRIFTDVVMANRMARKIPPSTDSQPEPILSVSERSAAEQEKPKEEKDVREEKERRATKAGPLSIWTTGVWERESMAFRFLEKSVMEGVKKYVSESNGVLVRGDLRRFVKDVPAPSPPGVKDADNEKKGWFGRVWAKLRRA
ncbi:HAD-superfamily phosphatase [Panus rudis PR-1116 ss-1]|nr:HAD-superfamily phosphatase [Panus rudis PR-1116 ss-1]